MDLREYYLDNVSDEEYYFQFYDLIENANRTYNVFGGYQETENHEFVVYDVDEVIEKFRYICQPENEGYNKENDCWFYLVSFYLFKCGFVIEEFPRVLERPPKERYDFVNKEIRNKIIAEGNDDNGAVRYAQRRVLISNLTFVQKDSHIELFDAIETKFKEISNRQASFQSMSTDEKLAEIANLIENLLKKDGKFLILDYSKICFEYINEDMIKSIGKEYSASDIHHRNQLVKEIHLQMNKKHF